MNNNVFPVVILAGGLATRLRPISIEIPKSLIDVKGEPFIAHQLRLLHAKGLRNVVICLGYLGEKIVDFVGSGERFGLAISYSFDGEKLLGTAGAIKQALPLLGDNFFILYGDSYLTCDYVKIQSYFENSNKQALMAVFRNENQWDKSNVEFKEGLIVAYDKQHQTKLMHHIDYGLGIFQKQAFEQVPENQCYDLASLYHLLLKNNQLAAYEVKERFYEVGSFSGIAALEAKLEAIGV